MLWVFQLNLIVLGMIESCIFIRSVNLPYQHIGFIIFGFRILRNNRVTLLEASRGTLGGERKNQTPFSI